MKLKLVMSDISVGRGYNAGLYAYTIGIQEIIFSVDINFTVRA
jgi:hypothetical protein